MKTDDKKTKKPRSESLRKKRLKSYVRYIDSQMEKTDKKHPWKLPHPGY